MRPILLAFALLAFPQDDLARKVNDLIPRLASDDVEARQKAAADLRALGRPSLPLLRDALKSEVDPEIKARLEELIHRYEAIDWSVAAAGAPKLPLLVFSAAAPLNADS